MAFGPLICGTVHTRTSCWGPSDAKEAPELARLDRPRATRELGTVSASERTTGRFDPGNRMRRRQLISLVAGALAGGGCAGSTRAPAGVSTPPAVVAAPITVAAQDSAMQARWVDTIFAPFARRNEPGCVVGVVRGGQLAIAKGYGAADLYRKIANTPRTPFYVASLSKQFTAMSVVLLAQDGKLSLTDDVRKWIPEVPRLGPITIEQLLNHTSGLRDYYSLLGITGWRPNELFTEATLLDLISRQRALNFTPGSEFLYNNTGYALLGIVVRRASGESLRQFAATRIFKPLGMTHTQFRDDHSQVIDGEAIGYLKTPTGYSVSIPQLDVVGDGGVFTTVEDLAKWDGNLDSGVVGGKAGVGMLQAHHAGIEFPIPFRKIFDRR